MRLLIEEQYEKAEKVSGTTPRKIVEIPAEGSCIPTGCGHITTENGIPTLVATTGSFITPYGHSALFDDTPVQKNTYYQLKVGNVLRMQAETNGAGRWQKSFTVID